MNYFRVDKENMVNGPGLRAVLWVAGCTHGCPECHNQETWDKCSGQLFDAEAKKELFDELDKDFISGVTLSGGDPLAPFNRDEITDLCKAIRKKYKNTKTIWCYTGFDYDQVKDLEVMKYIDVLVDGEFKKNLKINDLNWRGSINQHVIDIPDTRKLGKMVLEYI